jgi:hypothetical protein
MNIIVTRLACSLILVHVVMEALRKKSPLACIYSNFYTFVTILSNLGTLVPLNVKIADAIIIMSSRWV